MPYHIRGTRKSHSPPHPCGQQTTVLHPTPILCAGRWYETNSPMLAQLSTRFQLHNIPFPFAKETAHKIIIINLSQKADALTVTTSRRWAIRHAGLCHEPHSSSVCPMETSVWKLADNLSVPESRSGLSRNRQRYRAMSFPSLNTVVA